MTTEVTTEVLIAVGTISAVVVSIVAALLARASAIGASETRGKVDGERITKLELLVERVTKLEGRADASDERHDDLRELLKDMKAEILARIADLASGRRT